MWCLENARCQHNTHQDKYKQTVSKNSLKPWKSANIQPQICAKKLWMNDDNKWSNQILYELGWSQNKHNTLFIQVWNTLLIWCKSWEKQLICLWLLSQRASDEVLRHKIYKMRAIMPQCTSKELSGVPFLVVIRPIPDKTLKKGCILLMLTPRIGTCLCFTLWCILTFLTHATPPFSVPPGFWTAPLGSSVPVWILLVLFWTSPHLQSQN